MPIRIHIEDGPTAGEVHTFEDAVESVVIGRNPAQCQVVLPAEMTVVGREHMALRRQLGRYRLVLNGSNAVFVNGKPAIDGQELPAVSELQLGKDGPVLHIETLLPAGLADTIFRGRIPKQTPESLVSEARGRSRTNRRLLLLLTLSVLAATAVGVWAISQTQDDVRGTEQRLREEIQGRFEGFAKTSEAQTRAAQKLQGRLSTLTGDVDALRPDVRGLRDAMAGITPQLQGLSKRIEDQRPKIREHLRKAQRSVYLVLMHDDRGREIPLATAWVVAPGVVATNAHVALEFDKLPAGRELLLRSPGEQPRDFKVVSVDLHPGFRAFADLWKQHAPTRVHLGGGLEKLNEVPSCDVALMRVAEGAQLDAPLTLAPADALHALGPGDVVGYVGYPLEDMAAGAVNLRAPSPTIRVGHLTGVTNFFLGRTTPERSLLVQHSMTTVGGTSGSPVLDNQGRVIAMHNAGNFVFVGGKRVPGADVNFAQRVDLVQELLAGRAKSTQAVRTTEWQKGIAQFSSLKDAARTVALEFLEEQLQKGRETIGTEPTQIYTMTRVLEPSPSGSPAWQTAFEFPEAGVYVVFAYSTSGEDIDLLLLHPTDPVVLVADKAPDPFPITTARLNEKKQVRIRVEAGQRLAHGEFTLRIYRFPPKKSDLPPVPPATEPEQETEEK